MFFFLNFDKPETARTTYEKGVLFEKLAARIVEALGYRVEEIRTITAGKEYDVRAKAKLGGRLLIGQAKAWESAIPIKEISEFVGSLDVEDFPDDALGVFLSLTDLSPHAEEFLRKLKKSKRERIVKVVADDILVALEDAGYVSRDDIKRRARQTFDYNSGETYLLVSNRGDYFIQLLVRRDETRPKAFCVFSSDGMLISEVSFGNELRTHIEELQELAFLTHSSDFQSTFDRVPGPVGPGLEGANWFEYKLPAPPQFFVGRSEQSHHFGSFIQDVIQNKTNIRIYQVLSPSGVGKSSFVINLQSKLNSPTCIVDARNFRSVVDILAMLQDFLVNCNIFFDKHIEVPAVTTSVIENCKYFDQDLLAQNMCGVIFVDQFESLFAKPDIYAYFLDTVVRVCYSTKRVLFCIARRNDQPTTFDEKLNLDLQRLMSMALSVELKDFNRKEAVELLSHLEDEIGQPVKPKLHELALEFNASGFPWLCKRVGAHIRDAVLKRSISQDELIQAGISPGDLFEEDLAGLDMLNREFLRELARYLPATLDDLSQKFDGRVLAQRLQLFQDQRLVRLIGRTYDMYNDVFKEYLKTNRIPLHTRFIFRSAPTTTRKLLVTAIENSCDTVKDLSALLPSHSKGTIYNLLHELRILGLIQTERGQLSVDPDAVAAYKKGTLDALIKDRVWEKNALVRDVLNLISINGSVDIKQLTDFIRSRFPVLEVSEEIWRDYASLFIRWLRSVDLVHSKQVIDERSRAAGTLRSVVASTEQYLPKAYVRQIINVIDSIFQGRVTRKEQLNNRLVKDVELLGLVFINSDTDEVSLTILGQEFARNELMRPSVFRDFLLTLPYMPKYLDLVESGNISHTDVLKLAVEDTVFSEETWRWHSKILANWLEFSGLVLRSNGSIIRSNQSSMF
jgi:hypothetical protein